MKLLIDTHVFLWWLADSPRLSAECRELLGAPATSVMVSAASIWEIAIMSTVGKLAIDGRHEKHLADLIGRCGFSELPVTARHAAEVRCLPMHHADPFDRLLIAQARCEALAIATADGQFGAYGIQIIES
jgi:PIN domain nuclease of toxin-antitoxin system